MEETAQSAGDSADQLEGFSKKFRGAMSAAVTALAIGAAGLLSQVPVIGAAFEGLKAVASAVAYQMDSVLRPAISGVTDTLFEVASSINESDGGLGKLIGILGTVASGAGIAAAALYALSIPLTGPIVGAIALVAGAIAALWVAWETNFANIQGVVKKTWKAIRKRFKKFVKVVRPIFNGFLKWLSKMWSKHGDSIKSVVNFVFRTIGAIIVQTVDTILSVIQFVLQILAGDWEGAWKTATNFFKRLVKRWGPLVNEAVDAVLSVVSSLVDGTMEFFNNLASDISSWASGLASDAYNWGKNLIQGFIRGISQKLSGLRNFLGDLSDIGASVGIDIPSLGSLSGGGSGGGSSGGVSYGSSGGGGGTYLDGRQLTESTGRYRSGPSRRRGI